MSASRGAGPSSTQTQTRARGYAKYRLLADKQIGEFLRKKCDWSIFEAPPRGRGKLDAAGMLKKAYGSLHDNLATA